MHMWLHRKYKIHKLKYLNHNYLYMSAEIFSAIYTSVLSEKDTAPRPRKKRRREEKNEGKS